ncbi:hypothetical protein [Streptomyces kronopolitis]
MAVVLFALVGTAVYVIWIRDGTIPWEQPEMTTDTRSMSGTTADDE